MVFFIIIIILLKIFLKVTMSILISTLKRPDLTEKGKDHSNLETISVS